MKNSIPEIKFEIMKGFQGNLGVINLTRQSVLNALNHAMFIALDTQLQEWENDNTIKAVIIQAEPGRAFCAGGDIRSAYERKKKNDATLMDFFRDEYQMNRRIYHFPKPYIALLDGITMGGGVGISLHGSHRIGTRRLVFAMPETGIGFYPDVGTTHFLSRLPHQLGFYLGLTGAKIDYADCYAIGFVQEIVPLDSFTALITLLAETALPDKEAVSLVLKSFSESAPASELLKHQNEIETSFSKKTVEEIISSLEASSSAWCHETAEILKKRSPLSLKITLSALLKAKSLSFDECMKMEENLTAHFIENQDFFEGIRAAIIDKDQKPNWRPAMLAQVLQDEVEKYFLPAFSEKDNSESISF